MPIKSKTWNTTAGLNYIQDSELAFATIYSVKREGTGHDNYVSGSANRTYIHESSTGKILYPNVFNQGERVFAIYKPVGGVEPDPVCIPVGAITDTLHDGLVFQPYSKVITLSGTQPFVVTNITKPAWMTVTNSTNSVTLSGTPTTLGTQSVSFDVTNCGDTVTFSDSFEVLSGTVNLTISNSIPGSVIQTTNIPFVLVSGIIYPPPFDVMTAVHGAFAVTPQVIITLSGFPGSMTFFNNGSPMQVVLLPSSGTYNFDLVPAWDLDDNLLIQFN